VLTVDVPGRAKRPRELRHGLVIPFRPSLRTIYEAATSPAWLRALATYGQPSFPNLAVYVGPNPSKAEVAGFAQREVRGAFTWEEVARYRDRWKGPLVIKGIMHPADAEKAIALGIEGIQVSNHGGRQLEAAPASVDVLPAIAAAAGTRATILYDGGIRSGLDVMRTLALGAKSVLAGRAFLYGVGALGGEGANYVTALLIDEMRVAMRQSGVHRLADIRNLVVRHAGAMSFPPGAI
jgi:L-lactate dehydrogenase (cytochrome)